MREGGGGGGGGEGGAAVVERVSQAMVGLVAGGKRCVWLVHGAAVGDCGGVGGMRLVGKEKDTLMCQVGMEEVCG